MHFTIYEAGEQNICQGTERWRVSNSMSSHSTVSHIVWEAINLLHIALGGIEQPSGTKRYRKWAQNLQTRYMYPEGVQGAAANGLARPIGSEVLAPAPISAESPRATCPGLVPGGAPFWESLVSGWTGITSDKSLRRSCSFALAPHESLLKPCGENHKHPVPLRNVETCHA